VPHSNDFSHSLFFFAPARPLLVSSLPSPATLTLLLQQKTYTLFSSFGLRIKYLVGSGSRYEVEIIGGRMYGNAQLHRRVADVMEMRVIARQAGNGIFFDILSFLFT